MEAESISVGWVTDKAGRVPCERVPLPVEEHHFCVVRFKRGVPGSLTIRTHYALIEDEI